MLRKKHVAQHQMVELLLVAEAPVCGAKKRAEAVGQMGDSPSLSASAGDALSCTARARLNLRR